MKRYRNFINNYTDEVRHPIIADNDDWDEIMNAFIEVFAMSMMVFSNSNIANEITLGNWWRVFLEVIYVKGYEFGKESKEIQNGQLG